MTNNKKRVIAISGCKGGIGKTFIATNLALALTKRNQQVVLMDGDLTVPNILPSMGIQTDSPTLGSENHKVQTFLDPSGLKILSTIGHPPWKTTTSINDSLHLISKLDALSPSLDTLIIDTAPGLGPDNITLIQAAREIVVVINQDPVSLIDGIKLIRQLYLVYGIRYFYIIANAITQKKKGLAQFEQLQTQLYSFSDIILKYLGCIHADRIVAKALSNKTSVYRAYPTNRISRSFDNLASCLLNTPPPLPAGRIEIFATNNIKEDIKS